MIKYGYSDLNHKELLNAVFLMAAGFVPEKPLKSVFNSKSVNQFSKKVAILSMANLRALLYTIRNLFVFNVMQGKVVNPALVPSKRNCATSF
jgi:hypothetical protein